MTFGKYPYVSLALARERHSEVRKLLATGVDPMAQRKAAKIAERVATENSFAKVAEQRLERWREGKSPRHVDYVRRRMAADILPSLGTRPVTEIEAPEIVALATTIEKRGAREIAKRALEMCGQVFRYANAHGLAERNPAIAIKPSDILKPSRKANYARIIPGISRIASELPIVRSPRERLLPTDFAST